MRSRSNGGVIGAYALPNQNRANGVFFIHDAAIYNTGANPIWPLGTGYITQTSNTGTVSITTAANNNNYKLATFSSNGTFTIVTGSAYIDIFLVGGGGAGGTIYATTSYDLAAGGGGAGGVVLLAENVWVNAGTTFTVEVGQGGTRSSFGPTGDDSISDALNSGKPSRVTSGSGYSYFASGGAFGESRDNVTPHTSSLGGGGRAARSGSSNTNGTYRTTVYASGSPGTITTANTRSGGSATGTSGGYNTWSAGGGAGWTDGYAGDYSTDISKASAGGEAYQWPRTGYYYGGGGPGGGAYNWPAGVTQRLNASGQYYTGLRYDGAWAYINQNSSNGGADAPMNGYGLGGGGASVGFLSSAVSEYGGSGGSGTVIFCYRYR
jgi:hypothetical protein